MISVTAVNDMLAQGFGTWAFGCRQIDADYLLSFALNLLVSR
jgi:hypothetical protein